MKEIERIFYDDVRDKKRTGYGASKRASRKGYIRGGVKTQYDFLSTKERKKLNGEVRVMNVYDKYKELENLPKYPELKKMIKSGNEGEVKKILSVAKENNTSNAIKSAIGCSSGSLYGLYRDSGVPFESKSKNGIRKGKVKDDATEVKNEIAATSDVENKEDILEKINTLLDVLEKINNLLDVTQKEKSKDEVKNGFNISIRGEYSKKEIEERLLNLTGMLIEDSNYEISILISEKNK